MAVNNLYSHYFCLLQTIFHYLKFLYCFIFKIAKCRLCTHQRNKIFMSIHSNKAQFADGKIKNSYMKCSCLEKEIF